MGAIVWRWSTLIRTKLAESVDPNLKAPVAARAWPRSPWLGRITISSAETNHLLV